ncbi:MAG TPA: hypothetical protein VD948_07650 [Rhodothermales bacterium]|nr:hypothetical protein [Rhodothermales bacterium]
MKEALDSGQLKLQPHEALTIDNDSVYLYVGPENQERKVFGEGYDPFSLLEEALDLLGIPHQPA